MTATLGVLALTGGCASNDPPEAPPPQPEPIHTAEYVQIGGIDQWIKISGTDRRNPIILFVHGGPGIASSPFTSGFSEWEKHFTVAHWDQRGAGRTYIRNGESTGSTMTVERMAADGIEVALYLTQMLHKPKVVLVGASWGSILGVHMAHARPDLFHAYVGISQGVSWQRELAAGYARVHEMAQSRNDVAALDVLNGIGPPPWNSSEKLLQYRKVLLACQAQITTAPDAPVAIAEEYRADFRDGWFRKADDFAARHFWGPTLSGPVTQVDLTRLTHFRIPIFFVKGEVDLSSPPEIARAYFETADAPVKKFYLVPGAGHNPSTSEADVVKEILLTQVQPIAR